MKKAVLGIIAVVVVVGGGGCIIRQQGLTPTAERQAPQMVDSSAPSEVAPSPEPTTPDPSAREASSPSVSEIVVTKEMDKASSVLSPAPAPTPAGASTGTSNGTITAAVNVAPAADRMFSPDEAKGAIMFRWTPIVPKPQEPVTYRMRVWQLMQGQSGSQAMKTNQPIVTKDVADITEASISNIYTGPCRPPYLCDFVWSVTAMSGGTTEMGTSAPTSFSVTEPATTDDSGTGSATTDSSGAGTGSVTP
jgi:hypothetical protein